jgi:cellobiose phosphorylase
MIDPHIMSACGTAIDSPPPRLALLSNGQYSVVITAAGSGYSTWRGLDVTRWREDATRDCWGQFCYLRDVVEGIVWSVGYQPLCRAADESEFAFHADKAEFHRRDGDTETRLGVCVARDFDCEVRVVTVVNHSSRPRELELTSYAEVCLNDRRADQAHPAFAKLFLETEFVPAFGALLARRRPRASDQKPLWAIHVSAVQGVGNVGLEYETSRVRFLGRGRTPANPAALDPGTHLSGTTGPVLDAVFSLRHRIRLEPRSQASIAFITGAADTRNALITLAEQCQNFDVIDRAFSGAAAASHDELRKLGLTEQDVAVFNQLAASVIYTGSLLRDTKAVAANRLGQKGLWPHGISGDIPIVLVRISATDDEALVRQLMQWHAYTRGRGLSLDLVVMDERPADTGERLAGLRGAAGKLLGKPGGVYVLAADSVPGDDRVLLAAAARAVLGGGRGSLADQLHRQPNAATLAQPPMTGTANAGEPAGPCSTRLESLRFWNGFGGFTPDGREYVIVVDHAARGGPALPPAPWTNVLANPGFGCLVTEAGLGYSWAGNSQMNRLTPWSNDPVSDPPGEAVYLRDEETGAVWTPTPLPCGPVAPVTVRHGQGYTRYTHRAGGLDQELLVMTPPDDPVKLLCLTVRNAGERPRRLTATYYAEWVLGSLRDNAALQVVCDGDAASGAILARNAWAGAFAGMIAFASAGPRLRSATSDRAEFLGRNGTPAAPAGLRCADLSGRAGPGLDPCAAVMTEMVLAPGQTDEVVFVLGQAESLEHVRRLVCGYTDPGRARDALAQVQRLWDEILGVVQVTTPDAGFDLMVNRWLLYQVLACRVWGRSAFYQSGGAYGFRDQLQDVMALVHSRPEEARAQILRSASRQFEEGDVQHWWHPPTGVGVRTRITDDLFFLPLAVDHYVTATGDAALLDETVPFLKSPVLRPEQEEDFNLPEVSRQTGTVYEHCVRALEHGYRLGPHGLPLMGTGDWNDGMNKVGAHGKGESVWNGWFFAAVLKAFAEVAGQRGDSPRAAWCRERAEALRAALEANAWDGAWYRRAYFDDGTPLGSAQNDECQIDAIPQAWAVISGAAEASRAQRAMAAVEQRLVRPEGKLIQLFDPPFDSGTLQPGYIKGYVPGIRENGGQYTHAAAWVVLAVALQGRGDRALELWNMLNPIYHATTPDEVQRYQVEPYAVCADVYGVSPHDGRGGWTWYTGSASWLYRVALETILGLRLTGDKLRLEPCIPPGWPSYEVTYRHRSAKYRIRVDNPSGTSRGVVSVTVDGQPAVDGAVPLRDDGGVHEVRVTVGNAKG